MRVISGKWKGRKLFSSSGLDLRPTSDRVREAIFDILQDCIQGQKVLDLFAGTGALGIEALSRGAERAVFVERSTRSRAVLSRNVGALGLGEEVEIIPRDVREGIRILEARGEIFGLIFLDPPYGKGLARRSLQDISERSILAPEGLIIAEHSPGEDLEVFPSLEKIDRRKYGGTLVSFFHRIHR